MRLSDWEGKEVIAMNIIELFSGCGGLALGMKRAGFNELALVEFNKDACKSLRANFSPCLVYEGDVRKFDYTPYHDVDAIVGGPPCQPFSIGGAAKGYADTRDMFPEAARAIAAVKPRGFLFENVKGLLRPSFAKYFNYIKLRLTFPDEVKRDGEEWEAHAERLAKIDFAKYRKTKYLVFHRLLNAVDYGVPQKRERVIIVGLRSDLKTQFVFPEKSKAPPKTIRSVIGNLPQPSKNPDKRYYDHIDRGLAKSYAGHTGSPIDEPSKTIKAGAHGVPGGENTILYPDGTLRYMTVREAKLIQTFPPDYKILGNWGEAMRQIGNAVPVKLATLLGKSLMDALS